MLKDFQLDWKFALTLVILALMVVEGFFAYECWQWTKELSLVELLIEETKKVKIETGTVEKDEWGAMQK